MNTDRLLQGVAFFTCSFIVLSLFLILNFEHFTMILFGSYHLSLLIILGVTVGIFVFNVYVIICMRHVVSRDHSEREKAIRDYHRYVELLDPPSLDT